MKNLLKYLFNISVGINICVVIISVIILSGLSVNIVKKVEKTSHSEIRKDLKSLTINSDYIETHDLSLKELFYAMNASNKDSIFYTELKIHNNKIWFEMHDLRAEHTLLVESQLYTDFIEHESSRKRILLDYIDFRDLLIKNFK